MLHSNDENKIGVLEASAYCLGDIIGSGIFVSPSAIVYHTKSLGLAICIWIVCALIAVVGALVYVELGTSIRKSGCDFAYLTHVGWHPLAVAFLWVSATFTYPTILAIQTLAFGEYILQGVDNFLCISPDNWFLQRIIGFVALLLISFINMFSLRKFAGRFQVIVTASKMCVITIIIITGMYYIFIRGKTVSFSSNLSESKTDSGNIVLGLFAGLYAYNGWDILNFGAEEIENPRRTLPIAALFGIGVAAVVYVLINIAYFSVLSIEDCGEGDAVAAKFAEYALGKFSYTVPFLIGILLLGNFNTTIFGCSRYLFAGARKNVVPTMLKCVHVKSMSPRAAVALVTALAIGISFIGDLDHLIGYMSFAMWMQRCCVMIALLYMRYQNWPFPKDAFRTPIILPIIFLGICISLLLFSAINDPHIILYGGSIVIAGLIIYAVFIYPNSKPHIVDRINEVTVMVTQVGLNVMPLDDEEDQSPSHASQRKKGK